MGNRSSFGLHPPLLIQTFQDDHDLETELYPVEYLAVAEQMPRDKNWEELEALAEDAGTKVVWLGRGDIWHFGNATFTALHPGETEAAFGGQSVDKNEESLVLLSLIHI